MLWSRVIVTRVILMPIHQTAHPTDEKSVQLEVRSFGVLFCGTDSASTQSALEPAVPCPGSERSGFHLRTRSPMQNGSRAVRRG